MINFKNLPLSPELFEAGSASLLSNRFLSLSVGDSDVIALKELEL
jgi:hypothetical protein